jgi:hypothetical protein
MNVRPERIHIDVGDADGVPALVCQRLEQREGSVCEGANKHDAHHFL